MKSPKLVLCAQLLFAVCSVSVQAQTVARPALFDSTGNKNAAVGTLAPPTSSTTLTTLIDTTNATGQTGIPPGYVERTLTQATSPYFVVPGVEYPYENQVKTISYTAYCTAIDGYTGQCMAGPSSWFQTDSAQTLCGGVYDGRTIAVWPLSGSSNLGIDVSNVSQIVCSAPGSRSVTTLEKVSSSQQTTVLVTPIDYAALRTSLGANAFNVASANGVCIALGHPTGLVPGSATVAGKYYTCGNNTIGVWNNATSTWSVVGACTDNNLLGSLTCYK